VTSSDAALTKTSTVMGSPLYMSPEQMSSAKHVDVRTDVWSLGVSLFELLTCKTPFTGDSMTELIAAVLQREPLSISSVRADLPPDLVRAVAGALEKDREKRYPSVAAFAAAIAPFGPRHSEVSVERISDMLGRAPAPWAQGALPAAGGIAYEKTAAASSGAVAASSTGAGTTGQPVSSDRKGERAPRRRSFVAMVGGLGLVAVLGLGGALLLQRHARGVTPEPVAAAVPAQTASSPRVVAPVAAEPLRPSGSVTSDDSSNSAPPSAAAPPSAVHRQAPPPAVAPAPIGTAAKSATAPPASEPACKVVQYFDSDGEIRFKKECH
jgi:serine/threonine-protein kinase